MGDLMPDYALSVLIQWTINLAPALIIRRFRGTHFEKRTAILVVIAIVFAQISLWTIIADYLNTPALFNGNLINTAPIFFCSLISYWVLRKTLSNKNVHELSEIDKLFRIVFPEANMQSGTPEVKQEKQAATPAFNQTNQSARPEDKQASQPTTPPVNEDLLYHHAFKELEDDKKFIPTWSRAFAEAVGDEQKAKAIYIKYRVADLKLLWEEKRAAELEEAEKAARARENALASEGPKSECIDGESIDEDSDDDRDYSQILNKQRNDKQKQKEKNQVIFNGIFGFGCLLFALYIYLSNI